ncbi:MAG: GntR family transcriptional regulator [Clostridia bacterium]|nr:GntR family transcriptional regulator [Clostridia bacterium]
MFVIDPRSKAPLYEQLTQQLRWQIAMGFLAGDEPLPSVRQLSAELGINPNTIQKAYRLMEQEGLIYTQPGRGNFVTPSVTEQRLKQRESQLARLEEEMRKAKEMGIPGEEIVRLTRQVYGEDGAS